MQNGENKVQIGDNEHHDNHVNLGHGNLANVRHEHARIDEPCDRSVDPKNVNKTQKPRVEWYVLAENEKKVARDCVRGPTLPLRTKMVE
mmetsp:Transcript_20005/g.32994  ORF Transcript_20005/g.32994 Transcript_20005/m.32994 type:complete len:89 (+) Transcript_20005:1195-1461(+)